MISLQSNASVAERVGSYFIGKWKRRAKEVGHFNAATQMRKQGIPLETAREILFGNIGGLSAHRQAEAILIGRQRGLSSRLAQEAYGRSVLNWQAGAERCDLGWPYNVSVH